MKYIGFIFLLFSWVNLNAQEVTDYDLQNFARSYKETMKLNVAAQKEMVKIIEKAGLDLDLYHIIDESKNADYEPDVAQSEYDKYDKIQPEITKIQSNLEADVKKVYNKNDLTPQKYKAIAERVKQDYILQAKLEKILANMR